MPETCSDTVSSPGSVSRIDRTWWRRPGFGYLGPGPTGAGDVRIARLYAGLTCGEKPLTSVLQMSTIRPARRYDGPSNATVATASKRISSGAQVAVWPKRACPEVRAGWPASRVRTSGQRRNRGSMTTWWELLGAREYLRMFRSPHIRPRQQCGQVP